MTRGCTVTLWIVFGLGLALLAGAVYFSRDALLFRWKLRQLAEWEGGSYVARSLKMDLPDEIAELSTWFLERPDAVLHRLRGELRGTDRRTKMTALDLIWKIAADRGTKPDPEDFWRVFEDTRAVDSLISQPFEAILMARWQSLHDQHESGVLLVRSGLDHTALWRIPSPTSPNGAQPVTSGAVSGGTPNKDVRRRVARLATLGAIPEIDPRGSTSVKAQLFFLSKGADPSSELEPTPVTIEMGSWACLEFIGNSCLNLAEGEWPVHLVPAPTDETAPILCDILERGPKEAARIAAESFGGLSPSPATRGAALSRLQALAVSGRRNKKWAEAAIAGLSGLQAK